ncbi:MAG: hypothetical protein CVU56_26730 [Deltaproteobacteria bacterium HGW-Deltaproteobacteria-14]|jgi:phosphatidylserine/phosphatidylglycerophosphate/cardiolipin synthase-like enzyme|nr:MAG: hypothetical protein CVU56_26730 [Deltaproteobacteria bacterium HGW-Deltaproteobacteria-14]
MFRTTTLTLIAALLIAPGAAHALTVIGDGRIEIAFTTPGVSAETALDSDADDAVIALVDGAAATLDVCLYDFNHPGIVAAITAAADRGVAVRFVGDADEADQDGYGAMSAAGVPTSLRVGGAIMHNKFLVVDGRFVATGSMNHSEAGVFRNNNNLVVIDDAMLAADYTVEFEHMFIDGAFGRSKVSFAHPPVTVGQTQIQVAFSPADDPELVLRDALASADHNVYFMIYSFTHADIAADLIAAKQAGVDVVGVYDRFGATSGYATDEALAGAGVPVLLDGNENQIGASGGKLHHKVMIIDAGTGSDPMVITGSFNWSGNASTDNDENLIILRGADAVAPFMAEFCEVFDAALPHPANTVAIPDPCGGAPAVIDGPALVINELLPNPDGTDTPEEYIEVVNASDVAIDLTGWHLGDAASDFRHVFTGGVLEPGDAVVVYGGANAAEPERLVASTGNLSLNNASETVTLFSPADVAVDSVSYSGADSGQAYNRVTDGVGGALVLHSALAPAGAPRSPGLRVDGTPWLTPGQPLVIINELLPNPAGTDLGQEYVELVNMGLAPADLTGWRLGDAASDSRHVFAAGTTLAPGQALVIFDRGDHSAVANSVNASTESLSLNNSSETVTLYDADGIVVDAVTWASTSDGVALNRAADGDPAAAFVNHDLAAGATAATSPGLRVDGGAWGAPVTPPVDEEPPVVEEPPAAVPTAMHGEASGALAQGEWLDLGSFEAVAGSFVVTMTGTGDADLYVRQGDVATTALWDCRPYTTGSAESCTLTAPGTFFVSVRGYTAATFTVSVDFIGLAAPAPTAGAADVVIASLLADPNGTDLGQEYVVLANLGDAAADLSGWTVADASSTRHIFADGTTLAAGATLVLFDRGDHSDVAGAIVSSTGTLSLNNGGDTVTLADAAGSPVDVLTYAAVGAGVIVERAAE